MGIPDARSAGRSKSVPFIAGETGSQRHDRRLRVALNTEPQVQAWCDERRIGMAIRNEGQHWTFTLPGGKVVEGWPSSAKCVVARRYGNGIHAHDWGQVAKIIEGVKK